MKYCRHCGSEMKDEAAVCVKCGIAVKTPLKSEMAYCQSCGAQMNSQATLCTKCGVSQTGGGILGNDPSNGFTVNNEALTRLHDGKVLAGVCSGLGRKTNVNPWIFRAAIILLNLLVIGWFLDIAYVIAIFALPYGD